MGRPNRWTNNGPDGTNFHEIVVLPTLAPHLARTQHLQPYLSRDNPPNPPDRDAPGAPTQDTVEPQNIVANDAEGGGQIADTAAPEREFYIMAAFTFMQPAQGPRAKPKAASETRNGPPLPVLSMSRFNFLCEVLKIHSLEGRYRPSEISGFPFRISWSGSLGGKTNAPTIRDDTEFKNIIDQLSRTKSSVTNVLVAFEKDALEPFRLRNAAIDEPFPTPELQYGTHVPHVEAFSAESQRNGALLQAIKEEWKCGDHDTTCFTRDGKHFTVNRWKGKAWVDAIVAHKADTQNPPPGLFADEDARPLSTPNKMRGRTGPNSLVNEAATQTTELLTKVVPMVTSLLENLSRVPKTPSRKRTRSISSDPQTPHHHSPRGLNTTMPTEQLEQFIRTFAKAQLYDDNTTERLITILSEKGYRPAGIEIIPLDRLAEITQLKEGEAAEMIAFAGRWVRAHIGKRPRLSGQ